ncbi:STAS domain-containing protein [Streptacidiphilus monticola]|uniref:Anti-sigma factor antagonist n=1 Tax=Streptacidiphilus monticola TaxID=2161674 RepID=A0ABW1FUW3_9ACTN
MPAVSGESSAGGAMRPVPVDVQVETEVPGVVVCRLAGELDLDTVDGAEAALLEALPPGGVLIADLGGIAFFDSTGVNLLLRVRREALERDCEFRVACLSERLLRIFEITGVDQILPFYGSLAEARVGG